MATNSWNKLTWHWQKSILYWLNSRFFDLNGFSLSLWIISYDTLNLLAMVHVRRIKSGSIRRVKVEKETYRRICTCLECFLISKCYLSQLWRWVKTQIGDLQIEYSFLLFIAQWVRVQIQLWLVHKMTDPKMSHTSARFELDVFGQNTDGICPRLFSSLFMLEHARNFWHSIIRILQTRQKNQN